MKKLIIALLIINSFISCTDVQNPKESNKNVRDCPFNYYEFKYKGHDMVEFNNHNIMHSPECKKCFQIYD